jgi:hypothetical protein
MWLPVLGFAIPLVFWAWSWRGRSPWARWWVGTSMEERLVRGLLPAWILMAGSVVVLALTEGSTYEIAVEYVATVGIFVGAALMLWAILLIPIPRWWAPEWLRVQPEEMRAARTGDAFGAVVALSEVTPELSSQELAAKRLTVSRRLGTWHGNYVEDADSLERAHGLAARGAVAGRLTLLEDRIVFHASGAEDALRGHPVVVAIDNSEITDVRVVPAGAGADGVKRPGFLYRSAFPRLVVGTADHDYLFDVMRARRVAGQIRAAAGCTH